MTSPKLARVAAKLLAEEPIEERDPSKKERDRTVDAIRAELSRRAASGRRRRWAFPLVGIAAAVTLLGIGASTWSRHGAVSSATPTAAPPARTAAAPASPPNAEVVADAVRGTVFVEENGERVPLRSSAVVARGAKLVALDGEAILVLRSGSKVDVEHATVASLVEENETELIDVERGAVTSTVTKRGPTQRFLVRTPDAEVEVRGTVFRVSRLEDPRCGLQTRVHVDEGRVVVRAGQDGATLEPGGEWVSRCVAAPAPVVPAPAPSTLVPSVAGGQTPSVAPVPVAPTAASAPLARTPQNVAAPAVAPATSASSGEPATASTFAPSAPAASELAAQNALFADAMSSKARGDTASALTSLEFLLQKYPRTPLREAAEAQRMKLVATTDPPRAVGLAQAYLLHYPHGFARADAEKIAGALP
jgi:hypothetical protein